MVLLTSSQVSVTLSSAIVFIFTSLLFFSGYTIQQNTVRGLQQAIKPIAPPPPPSYSTPKPLSAALKASRLFGGPPGSRGHVAYQEFTSPDDAGIDINWRRLAHLQLVRSHNDICNAIMIFGEMHRLKSPARRVLLFPESWAMEKQAGKGEIKDPFMDSSRRLLRLAARRYGVELLPVSPMVRSVKEGVPDVYSLASAYRLTDFDRVLVLETPGMILDASPLDAVLAFTESTPFAMLHDTVQGDGVHSQDLFLLEPSKDTYKSLKQRVLAVDDFNDAMLGAAFDSPLFLASSSAEHALIRSVSTLHDADADFNATAYLSTAAYIRFSDPKLPGPQYDVPYYEKVKARPKNKNADWLWTKLYGQFAQNRMEICGLDLEPWREETW